MNFPDSQGLKPKIYEFSMENVVTTFVRLAEFLEIDPNELIVEVEEDEYCQLLNGAEVNEVALK